MFLIFFCFFFSFVTKILNEHWFYVQIWMIKFIQRAPTNRSINQPSYIISIDDLCRIWSEFKWEARFVWFLSLVQWVKCINDFFETSFHFPKIYSILFFFVQNNEHYPIQLGCLKREKIYLRISDHRFSNPRSNLIHFKHIHRNQWRIPIPKLKSTDILHISNVTLIVCKLTEKLQKPYHKIWIVISVCHKCINALKMFDFCVVDSQKRHLHGWELTNLLK